MTDMRSRNEYLKVLRERYLKARTRKEKSWILDEYCCNTGQARKYVIRKIQPRVDLRPNQRKKRMLFAQIATCSAMYTPAIIFSFLLNKKPTNFLTAAFF